PEESAARVDAARAALRRVRAPLPRALELLIDRTRPDDAEVAARIVAALDQLGLAVSYTALPPNELQRRGAARPRGPARWEAAAARRRSRSRRGSRPRPTASRRCRWPSGRSPAHRWRWRSTRACRWFRSTIAPCACTIARSSTGSASTAWDG